MLITMYSATYLKAILRIRDLIAAASGLLKGRLKAVWTSDFSFCAPLSFAMQMIGI